MTKHYSNTTTLSHSEGLAHTQISHNLDRWLLFSNNYAAKNIEYVKRTATFHSRRIFIAKLELKGKFITLS